MFLCDNPEKVKVLFKGWQETMIYSYLQGCMGECYVDQIDKPQSAQILIADFCFFAGVPCLELVFNVRNDFVIMVPQNEEWSLLIEDTHGQHVTCRKRFATMKKNSFDQKTLQAFVVQQLDSQYELKMIDKDCYQELMTSSYHSFHDLCGQFKTYEEYAQKGLGFVILKEDQIISGASSYTYYREGIEIEIDTLPDYRRQGLAKICGAKLILECLQRHLYPSWDAQNEMSLKLAEKLGYQFDRTYTVYEFMKSDIF